MTVRTIAFLALALLAYEVSAENAFVPEKRACVVNPNDPFEPGATMHFGPHIGHCVDTSSQRALYIVSETADEFILANFSYHEKWWMARISKHDIDTVSFQWVRMPPEEVPLPGIDGAHAQLHFTMHPDHPIILTSQIKGENLKETISGFVVSSTPFSALGLPVTGADFFLGHMGMYTVAAAFDPATLTAKENGKVKSQEIPLGLDAGDRSLLMSVAIHRGNKFAYDRIYNPASANCNTSVFEALDEAFPPLRGGSVAARMVAIRVGTVYDPVIGPATHALEIRNLTSPMNISRVTCVSKTSLRLNLDGEHGAKYFAKVGFSNGQIADVYVATGDGLSPFEFNLKDDVVTTVSSLQNCAAPKDCVTKTSFEEWDKMVDRMLSPRVRIATPAPEIAGRQVLLKVLANEADLRAVCSDFGDNIAAK